MFASIAGLSSCSTAVRVDVPDRGKPPRKTSEVASPRVDPGAAQILQQIVMRVNAVESRLRRM